jgi:hypothetical protein
MTRQLRGHIGYLPECEPCAAKFREEEEAEAAERKRMEPVWEAEERKHDEDVEMIETGFRALVDAGGQNLTLRGPAMQKCVADRYTSVQSVAPTTDTSALRHFLRT